MQERPAAPVPPPLVPSLALTDSEPVLVRGSMRLWDIILTVVMGSVLVMVAMLAAVLVRGGLIAGGILLLAGVAMIVIAILVQVQRVRNRMWVRDTGSGFGVIDVHGAYTCPDGDIVGMALLFKRNYSAGIFKSITRRFLVWLQGDHHGLDKLEMSSTFGDGEIDPLNALIQRTSGRLHSQALADRQVGKLVRGQSWRLDGQELVVVVDEGEETAAHLDEISAVEHVEGRLCLWLKGEDHAWASLSEEWANVSVLARLLEEEMAKRPKVATPPPLPGQLGRIIFQRAQSRGQVLTWQVFGGVALFITVILALAGMYLGALIGLGVTILIAFGSVHAKMAGFRCHEFGVYKSGITGARQIRYTDVEAFTYGATRIFVNGAYSGTSFSFVFEPMPGTSDGRIKYSVQLPHADQELENLRDHIAKVIAGRMQKQLAAGKTVDWTPNMRFEPDGIEYEPSGFFGRKDSIFIHYDDIRTFNLQTGYFYLWEHGKDKPVVTEAIAQRNFFPGYYVLLALTQPAGGRT